MSRPEVFQFSKAAGRFVVYIDTDDVETVIPPGKAKAAEATTFVDQAGKRKKPANPKRA